MERDASGRVTRHGLSLPGVPLFVNILVAELTNANGGRLFDLRTGRPTFTEKPVVEVLDFYKKLNDTVLPPGWLGHGYEAVAVDPDRTDDKVVWKFDRFARSVSHLLRALVRRVHEQGQRSGWFAAAELPEIPPPISIARSRSLRRSVRRKVSTAGSYLTTAKAPRFITEYAAP